MHTHVAETRKEVDDCIEKHGMTPVQLLDSIGVLDRDVVAAHIVHVDDKDIEILSKRGVVIAHNPCSNLKLGSGLFEMDRLIKAGCRSEERRVGNRC